MGGVFSSNDTLRKKDGSPIVVLITGCSSGIGLALSLKFARSDCCCSVYATSRYIEPLQALVDGLTVRNNITIMKLDVTSDSDMDTCVSTIMEREGCIDVLINNAGVELFGPLVELSMDKFRIQLETNVTGVLALTQKVAKHMMISRKGRIINIGSAQECEGFCATPFAGAYGCSKFAVHALSDALRMELAPFDIDVIVVAPGSVDSSLQLSGASFSELEKYNQPPSMYHRCYGNIEGRISRGVDKQKHMNTNVFVDKVVPLLLRKKCPAYILLARYSFILPFIARWFPRWLTDVILSRRFGLNKLY